MPKLERLLYVSQIAPAVTPLDVQRILWVSNIRNRRLDVTGMLAVTHRHFAQVLEGAADALRSVLGRVESDPRHTGVRVLAHGPLSQRRFGAWDMGLIDRYDLSEEAERLFLGGALEPQSVPELIERMFVNPA